MRAPHIIILAAVLTVGCTVFLTAFALFSPIDESGELHTLSDAKSYQLWSLKSFPNEGDILYKREGSRFANHTKIYGFVDTDRLEKFANENGLRYEERTLSEQYESSVPPDFGRNAPTISLGLRIIVVESRSDSTQHIRLVASHETGEFVATIPAGVLR